MDGFRAAGPPTLGIGILTYNRLDKLKRSISALLKCTSVPFHLVIADDGSSDGTPEFLESSGIARICGTNMGVCWNKNRLLYFLTNVLACDAVLLLEDDSYPAQNGWEQPWIEAIRLHGHMNYAGGWFGHFFRSGAGTPEDPVECKLISGQCVGYSSAAIRQVGYFDTRFRGYGIGHVEHSWRMVHAGFGGRLDPQDADNPNYFLLRSEIRVDGEVSASSRDATAVQRNQEIFAKIRQEPIHRWAWRTDEEMCQFVGEMEAASATRFEGGIVDAVVSPELEIDPPHLFEGEHRLFSDAMARYGQRYLEFGTGGSTVLAAKAGSIFVGVDSDTRWLNKLKAQPAVARAIKAGRGALLHVDIGPLGEWGFPADESRAASWPDYIRFPWTEWDSRRERPDLVFVDGRFRVACCLSVVVAMSAWRAIGDTPRVLLHDFNAARPFYQPVLDFFEIEAVENSLHLLRIRRDASPLGAMAAMLGSLSDPR
ncbi:MAG: glycosyltransferase [Pseudomonadota bacterium]|nr:glycosyltransferase [Pseudomonadota bacterium]